ncbi:MAG: Ig-like domain-containing protein, partial [Spirochaetaceae bacterium]|nr:Ig-like domain-containing protein [Spirochaetaceae bacterium]
MHPRANDSGSAADWNTCLCRPKLARRRVAAVAAAAILCLSGATAQKKTELTPVDGLENWKYGLDLSEYPPGKYNLIVEGRDKAGNVTQALPMNIFVDPESDLPRISIVNPIQGMRVGGDLNIVGTCTDDDGVERVEISLDGGEYVAADGGEFWFLYLKTAELPEGRRLLDIRGVDINGLEGPPVRVAFELDRTKPTVAVESPPTGSLVSGAFSLSGNIFDANGVRSLEISDDDRTTWKKLNLVKTKDPLSFNFSMPIDTRKFEDGPKVFSFRGVDGVGSTSNSAYMLFIDNTKPAIEIARPSPDQAINGLFVVAGAVRDTIGVKRLSYT